MVGSRCVFPTWNSPAWVFAFNQPFVDFEVPPVIVQGGFKPGGGGIDDPFAAIGRGRWFNGEFHHYTV